MTPSYVTLRKRSDFDRVFRDGRRIRTGGITVIRCPRSEAEARVGFVVSRRLGDAVERNRIKRRLREAARRVAWQEGCDYVVLGSAQVGAASFPELIGWLAAAA